MMGGEMPKVVRVVVDSRIRLSPSQLDPEVVLQLKERFAHRNPQHHKLKAMGYRFDHRKEPAQIKTWSEEGDDELSFPRGGIGRVREVLHLAGVGIHVVDERTEGELPEKYRRHFEWPAKMFAREGDARVLYPDQERLVEAMLSQENCCVRGGTGGGKTSSLIAASQRVKLPTLILVWTGGLFDQWVDRVEGELGIDRRMIGQVQGSKRTYSPITVAMQPTVAKLDPTDEFFRWWGFVGADELSRFAATTFVRSVDPFVARYRIGVSADERRKDGKAFLIHDEFGDVAIEVGHDELVSLDRVVDVGVVVHETGWRPVMSGGEEADELLGEQELDMREGYKLVLDAMEADEGRTALAVRIAAEQAKEGHRVLVFSQRVQHCRRMDQLLNGLGVRTGLLLGGKEHKDEFRRTVAKMRDGSYRVAVGTVQAVGLGLDLPSVDRGVVAMPIAANKQLFNQVRGRLCRKADGKGDAWLHYLLDEWVFPNHLRNIRAWAKQVKVAETRVSEG
jgi:superfamily II DNA or RNA helicase